MVQFEPEIVQNITVSQHKKKIHCKPKQPAGGDARKGKYSLLHSIGCILIKTQKVHLKDTR